MTCKTFKCCTLLILISLSVFSPSLSFSEQEVSLLEVTPRIREYAINTSKSEWTAMPEGFSPDFFSPPKNIPIRFESYPDVTFLLRKIGKDYNDDCNDKSLAALMNISRSGDPQNSNFKWESFEGVN